MVSVTGSDLRRSLIPALTAMLVGLAGPALAAEPSAADKAAAEALFEHGKLLMKQGRYAEACPKFVESQNLDSGIGTMLNLADCYEKNGQTASAWAEFLEAAAAAKAAGQAEREKKARERAAALEPKLSRLVVTVAPGAVVTGFEVKRDGAAVQRPLWGTPVPVDPGEHEMAARAPGKKPWSMKISIKLGEPAPVTVVIPVLQDAPAPPPVVAPPPPIEPEKPVAPLHKPPPERPAPIVPVSKTVSGARITGYTFLGLGLAGGGAGGILGMLALMNNSDASVHCRANNVCDSSGADSRNSALGMARGSNIALIAGGTSFLTGLIILLATNPSSESSKMVLKVSPVVNTGASGLSIEGAF